MTKNSLEIINNVLEKCESLIQKGLEERLDEKEIAEVLSTMLFDITRDFDRVVEVRDYNRISEVGTFKYSGQADTMFKEGLMPEDVYLGLKGVMKDDPRHIGPSYLRVKGLLTHIPTRMFFGRQMAFKIRDYLNEHPLDKQDGFVVCVPNMTGGAWIGDETVRQLQSVLKDYKVWPATPYAREMRKLVDVILPQDKFVNYVEGLMPTPQDTAMIFPFEELRTAAETTQNATKTFRNFGYTTENGVRIAEACVFDYGHPVGVERLKRLGAERLYLVGGKVFFEVSKELMNISEAQDQTAMDWLNNPWDFTRKVLPDVKRLAERKS